MIPRIFIVCCAVASIHGDDRPPKCGTFVYKAWPEPNIVVVNIECPLELSPSPWPIVNAIAQMQDSSALARVLAVRTPQLLVPKVPLTNGTKLINQHAPRTR
jgi:hypothetical protein